MRPVILGSIVLFTSLSSCTNIDVARVCTEANKNLGKCNDVTENSITGMRYYLPQPVIIMKPQADGSVDVAVDYLPDRLQQYAVTAKSIFASHELSMKMDNGLLSEVSLIADTSAIAAATAAAVGEIQKARIEAETSAAQAAASQVSDITKSLQAAKVEEAQAKAKYLDTPNEPADKKLEAKLAWDAAKAKVTELEAQVEEAQAKAKLLGISSGDVVTASYEPARAKAWGPVMFRVVADGTSVKLEPISQNDEPNGGQHLYDVYSVNGWGKESSAPSQGSNCNLKVNPANLGTIQVDSSTVKKNISFDVDVGELTSHHTEKQPDKTPVPDAHDAEVKRLDSKHVEITFSRGKPVPNTYMLIMQFGTVADKNKLLGEACVPFKIQ